MRAYAHITIALILTITGTLVWTTTPADPARPPANPVAMVKG